MAVNFGPSSIVTDGLVLNVDPSSTRNNTLTEVEVLVVAGGGGGGSWHGGGGGGGGVVYNSAYSIVPGIGITVTVGNGGTSGGNTAVNSSPNGGGNGQNSVFGNITAIGGGGGGSYPNNGSSGGSGGGPTNWFVGAIGGSGTVGQGNSGSNSGTAQSSNFGGGGGGAGEPGGKGLAKNDGGNGLPFSISGRLQYYGGGGGAGVYPGYPFAEYRGQGGLGGGGYGGDGPHGGGTNPRAGTPNTGGGGGGAADYTKVGGSGGSGIVIVRYPGPQKATGGNTITSVGGYTIHTFTSSGTFTPLNFIEGTSIYGLRDLVNPTNQITQVNGLTYSTLGSGSINFGAGNTTKYLNLSTPYLRSATDSWSISYWVCLKNWSQISPDSLFWDVINSTGSSGDYNAYYSQNLPQAFDVFIDSSDGKIYLVNPKFFNSTSKNSVVLRFNSNDTLDDTFTFSNSEDDAQFQNYIIKKSTYFSNRFYVVTGRIIYRVNSTGQIELRINTSSNRLFLNDFITLEEDPSTGKIYVGGNFTSYNGTSVGRIMRLNTDGSIDNTFNSGTGFDSLVRCIKIYPSTGKIFVIGNFTSYNGTTANRIIRLNTDGSIDNTFTPGTGFGENWAGGLGTGITIDSNGKLYIGGGYLTYNGTTVNRLVRINYNGTLDTSFNVGTGFNNFTYEATIDPSTGKLYIGGAFTSYNGTTANRIIKLNTDGSIDNTFNYGTGFDNQTRMIRVDSSGNLYVAGFFNSYNGTSCPVFIKLSSTGSVLNSSLLSNPKLKRNFDLYDLSVYSNNFFYFPVPLSRIFSSKYNLQYPYSLSDLSTTYFNEWICKTDVYDRTTNTLKVYYNGQLYYTTTNINIGAATISDLGRSTFNSQAFFEGNLGKYRIYNRVLSDSEVLQNFNADRSRYGV